MAITVYKSAGNKITFVQGRVCSFYQDTDYNAYITAVLAAGGTLTEKKKVNIWNLVKKLKDANLWSNLQVFYPLEGGTAASCAINLINPSTYLVGWNNTVAADFTGNGWQNNGSAYGQTGFIPSTHLTSISSSHIGFYTYTTAAPAGVEGDIGATTAAGTYYQLRARDSSNSATFACYSTSSGAYYITVTIAATIGHYLGNRTSASYFEYVRNNSVLDSKTVQQGTLPAVELYIGARNGSGTAASISSRQYGYFSIGSGLSTAQKTPFYNIMTSFIANK